MSGRSKALGRCAARGRMASKSAARGRRRKSEIEARGMSTDKVSQFANQNYLSLESYRKTGNPVATPMWFTERNGTLYVYSLANAGKVKRIRNNAKVRVVPSDMRGKPK